MDPGNGGRGLSSMVALLQIHGRNGREREVRGEETSGRRRKDREEADPGGWVRRL